MQTASTEAGLVVAVGNASPKALAVRVTRASILQDSDQCNSIQLLSNRQEQQNEATNKKCDAPLHVQARTIGLVSKGKGGIVTCSSFWSFIL